MCSHVSVRVWCIHYVSFSSVCAACLCTPSPSDLPVQLSLKAASAHGGAGSLLPAPLPARGHTPTHLLTDTIVFPFVYKHQYWYSPLYTAVLY